MVAALNSAVSSVSTAAASYAAKRIISRPSDPTAVPPVPLEASEESALAPASSQGPRLFALLIGINTYQSVTPLHGCVADAEAAKAYLENDLAVPSSKITILRNKEATRAGIIAALQALAANKDIEKGDAIVIFYAGHGSVMPTPKGWDAGDSEIQMLVPQDYCPSEKYGKKVVHGIPDRTIGALLEALANEKGDNISVIFDCCHSGSGSRDDDTNTTYLNRTIKSPEVAPPSDLDKDIWGGSRATEIPPGFLNARLRSHVLLAACSAKETAPEINGRGVFSKELFTTLSSVGADKLTYKDVLFRMHTLPRQNPQCEGVHQDRILFNAKAPSQGRALFKIQKAANGYTLFAGTAHGITEEAQFAVYASREAFGDSAPLGTLVVAETAAFTSTLKSLPDTAAVSLIKEGVALQTLAGVDTDLRIHIAAHEPLIPYFKVLFDYLQRTDPRRRRVLLVDEDKADFKITYEDQGVVFYILNTIVAQYGASRIPHAIDFDKDSTSAVISAAADFNWNLKRVNKSPLTVGTTLLRDKIKIEFYRLEGTAELNTDFNYSYKAVGNNLNVDGIVDLVVDSTAIYGIKITNATGLDLYPSLFFFDSGFLSIKSYFLPPSAGNYKVDAPLRAKESLTIGYGAGGAVPFNYTVLAGQKLEVGFLKLFFATQNVDLSGIAQASPFAGGKRGDNRPEVPVVSTWDTITVAVVQRAAA